MNDAYDDRPYTEHAYAETHPIRLAATARLARWIAPPIESARILELGCGRGGNLLPMAAGLPRATLVGVDASARQIADASQGARAAGLTNVSFIRATFRDLELSAGAFDFVLCHGVLSWIAPDERPVLLDCVARALAPAGVGYVSFNVLPGWYDRLAARDWLRFAVRACDTPPEGAADSVDWLRRQVSPEQADYGRRLGAVAARLRETSATYARHEYLADQHHPLLVSTFLAEASAARLTYVADAVLANAPLALLGDEARERARELSVDDAQQLADFALGTAFRRALVVRADAAAACSYRSPFDFDERAVASLWIASRLRPAGDAPDANATDAAVEAFADGDRTVQVSGVALRRALHELSRVAPAAVAFHDLCRRVGALGRSDGLAADLLDLAVATGALDLLAAPFRFTQRAVERPVACPWARRQAACDGVVTNRLHQEVAMPDAIVRHVLARLDGTRTRGDLAAEAKAFGAAVSDEAIRAVVDACVERLAACGLVVESERSS